MPTYDYVCEACQHSFEHFQRITANSLRKCPECGKLKLKRLIGTGAGILFKGSGFYETDYRSDSYKKAAKAEADAAKPKSDSSDAKGKSESKKNSDTSTTTGGKTTQSKKSGSGDKA